MRVGFFQFAPVFGEYEENIDRITEGLKDARADLIVLPELALSGYNFTTREEAEAAAETVPGKTTEILQKTSRDRGSYIVTGMAEKGEDGIYNSAVLIGPDGVEGIYRKMHLFAGEKRLFSSGNKGFPLFKVNGINIGMLVCFDHLFPEAARSLALKGARIICHPSNLVLPEYGQLTTRVRSVENRVFWILANRHGTESRKGKSLTYTGNSQITAPDGRILSSAPAGTDSLTIVEINPEEAADKHITAANDLFEDRRTDYYTA